MPNLLRDFALCVARDAWIAIIEALPVWILLRLCFGAFTDIRYWVIILAFFIHNFILTCIKTYQTIKNTTP